VQWFRGGLVFEAHRRNESKEEEEDFGRWVDRRKNTGEANIQPGRRMQRWCYSVGRIQSSSELKPRVIKPRRGPIPGRCYLHTGSVYEGTNLTTWVTTGRLPSEAGSYLRSIDSCITQLKAQGPSRTCNESKEEEDYLHSPLGGGCEEDSPDHPLRPSASRLRARGGSQLKNNHFT